MNRLLLAHSASSLGFALLACTPPALDLPEIPAEIAAQVGQVEAPPGEHLLLYPTGEPEGLLGREIQLSGSGGWTIADARAPGCEVSVRRVSSQYERQYKAELGTLAVVSAGYKDLLSLGASHGTGVVAQATVKNSTVVVGDFRGSCGSRVIDSVRVGTGERTLLRSARTDTSGGLALEGLPLEASSTRHSSVGGRFAWGEPQGYAFTYRELEATESIGLRVAVPATLTEGDTISLEVSTTKPAFIVLFFLEQDDRGGVLLPSEALPVPVTRAGASLRLPPVRAALRQAGVAAFETLVAYAFTEQADFERLKPVTAAWDRDAAQYAAELTAQLANVPIRRWDRVGVTYEIKPKVGAVDQAAGSPR